jgi:hypothetical protein
MTEMQYCLCGNELGRVVLLKNVIYLDVGGMLLDTAHGVCKQCGRGVHHTISTRAFKRLLKTITPNTEGDQPYLEFSEPSHAQ